MALLIDTVSFPVPDGVTGQPTIDGWTGNTDSGLVQSFAEPGFATSGRITYGGGAPFPPVAFQCMRVTNPVTIPADGALSPAENPAPGDYLALSFFCTFDPTFDNDDVVVIALKPTRTDPPQNARRIDLRPVTNGIGAGAASDPEVVLPGTPVGNNYHLKLHKKPALETYVGQPAGSSPRWVAATFNNVYARCGSWWPPTIRTNASGQSLPAVGSAFTFTVSSTGGFPDAGAVLVDVGGAQVTISYAGKTATTFTNCTADGTGTVGAGAAVRLNDVGWSVELLLPMTIALGGGSWFDIADNFGLYANLIRINTIPIPSVSNPPFVIGHYATEFAFPVPDGTTSNRLTGLLGNQADIHNDYYGTGRIPPPGTAVGAGVRFRNHASPSDSVGVLDVGVAVTNPPGDQIHGGAAGTDNRFVAQIENTGTVTAPNLTAEFRIYNWGLGPAGFALWAPASNATPDYPTTGANPGVTVNAGGTGELTWTWPASKVPQEYSDVHTCIWVRLDSAAGAGSVNFVESGVRRNINFDVFSEVTRVATVSGSGYPAPSGGRHEFLLFPHVRTIAPAPPPDPGEPDGPVIGLVEAGAAVTVGEGEGDVTKVVSWVVDAGRRTGDKLTIDGTEYEVLDPSPGQFGITGTHVGGAGDVLGGWLSGGGIRRHGPGYSLHVPHNGTVRINARVAMAPPEEIAKIDEEERDSGGDVPWWLRFLRWLIHLIRRLFGGS
jgi:hypothetical protein